jgi:hypothetical protein
MAKMLTVKETAEATNLSEYAIRQGIAMGMYPAVRVTGKPRGRILINIELFVNALDKLATDNIREPEVHVKTVPYYRPFERLRKIMV